MLHQYRAQTADLVVQSSDALLQPLVFHGQLLDLGLEFLEPGLLALAAFEGGCGASAEPRRMRHVKMAE